MEEKGAEKGATVQTVLVDISRSFEMLARQFKELAELLDGTPARDRRRKSRPANQEGITSVIEKLKNISREEAERFLEGLSQQELGNIFATFGPSRDRKKPKQWLINQILWHFYDFEAGHRILRGDSGQ